MLLALMHSYSDLRVLAHTLSCTVLALVCTASVKGALDYL